MVEKNLDFRSDTVTKPTVEMIEASMNASLGDDGYGEDPTVNELERLTAKMLGKEASLFVPSGTQGNEIALLTHTQRGDEIILESKSHIYRSEVGGLAVIGGLMTKTVEGELGWMNPKDLEAAIRVPYKLHPRTSLICIENTHNAAGGIPLTTDQMKGNWDVAKENGLTLHLDGARIFNAAISLGVDVKDLAEYADSVMFCLSKGLSCPVGSMLVGTEEFIIRARKYRSMLGGGMRQAGVIAAPGIVALTKMVERLAEDHENASLLDEGLTQINGINVLNPVSTNMVYIDFTGLGWTGQQWIDACAKIGWKTRGNPTRTRLCTHYGIEREDIEAFLEGIRKLVP